MKINWKLRFKNKATLAAVIACVVAFAYQMAGLMGIVPPVSQDMVMQGAGVALNILVAIGVLVDPTTHGASDSQQAMTYKKPKKQ